jgi:hypothetical protein
MDKTSEIFITAPFKNALLLLMVDPENISSNDVDPAHFHFDDFIFPEPFITAAKVEFTAYPEKRLSIQLHIVICKTDFVPR